jgi:hypothetical protein
LRGSPRDPHSDARAAVIAAAPAVLFARGGALGDFVITLGLLDALLARAARQGLAVDVACNPRFAPLLAGLAHGSALRRVIDLGGAGAAWMFAGRVAAEAQGYVAAVAFSAPLAEGLDAAGIPVVGRTAARPPAGLSALAWFAQAMPALDGLVGDAPAASWEAPPVLTPAAFGARTPELVVVLAPGAGAPEKRLPLDVWAAVGAALAPWRVRWIAGPVEDGEAWPTPPERPDLRGLAAVLGGAGVVLGADSGPAHLAGALFRGLGRTSPLPVGVVFRATDPHTWAPPGARVFHGRDDAGAMAAFAGECLQKLDRNR